MSLNARRDHEFENFTPRAVISSSDLIDHGELIFRNYREIRHQTGYFLYLILRCVCIGYLSYQSGLKAVALTERNIAQTSGNDLTFKALRDLICV